MKTWKLVSGIVSVVLFCVVMLQSCAATFVIAASDTKDAGGIAGAAVGFLLLAGGVVSIATHRTVTKGNKIALLVLFGLAALLAFCNAAVYKDLIIWGIWCAINAFIALVADADSID